MRKNRHHQWQGGHGQEKRLTERRKIAAANDHDVIHRKRQGETGHRIRVTVEEKQTFK